MVQFLEGRNRAWAQFNAPINGSDTNVALVAGQGSRLSDVTTASGRKVRAQIYERDAETGAITKCELVDITNNVSDVLIIERAVESTRATDTTNTYAATPQSFTANAIIEEVISSEVISEIQDEVNNIYDVELPLKADQASVDALTNIYAAASGGTDNYAFTIPGFTGYAANVGKTYKFLADVPNSGASGVNISGYGNIPMYKGYDNDTVTGDIKANQIITIVIGLGGTSVQMTSQVDTIVDLSSYATRSKTYTISGGVIAGDVVYPSAADTVKKIGPSSMSTGAAITTAPTHLNATRSMPLSTNGLYLHVSGGSANTSAILYAQVRTINAGETDFTNGSEVTIYGTGNGVPVYDICNIGTDKFLLIFQCDTGGVEVGIKTVVISVSGTTITVGAVQTIETTGAFSNRIPSCAKLDTDKAIIFYQKDADLDIYGQVLTVSTTTITTNTPVSVRVTGNNCQTYAVSLGTNAGMVLYCDNAQYVYGRTFTVSGTVPTFATEQQVLDNGASISSSNHIGLGFISATKVLLLFGEGGVPTNDYCALLTISGATITKGSNLALSAYRSTDYFGISILGTSYALVADFSSNTQIVLKLLDISGATPTEIQSQNLSTSTTSNNYEAISIVKILPWTYMISGPISNGDYIVKLTPISTARVGVAEGTIADGATGAIAKRFNNATLSGLTVGSKYYVNDDGNITVNSSLTAPEVGYADSTTNLILT